MEGVGSAGIFSGVPPGLITHEILTRTIRRNDQIDAHNPSAGTTVEARPFQGRDKVEK